VSKASEVMHHIPFAAGKSLRLSSCSKESIFKVKAIKMDEKKRSISLYCGSDLKT